MGENLIGEKAEVEKVRLASLSNFSRILGVWRNKENGLQLEVE